MAPVVYSNVQWWKANGPLALSACECEHVNRPVVNGECGAGNFSTGVLLTDARHPAR